MEGFEGVIILQGAGRGLFGVTPLPRDPPLSLCVCAPVTLAVGEALAAARFTRGFASTCVQMVQIGVRHRTESSLKVPLPLIG